MCGIVALFSDILPVSEQSLQSAIKSLRHRGPDDQGRWLSANRQVALGHTRLSIIDPPNGKQPISNRERTLHIVCNGEFYGFEQIQDDLERRNYEFSTGSDSEIALHLYDEFGTECLRQLRGEFAFVIWDERNQQLFAARDRFGIKPLYYSTYRNTVYLASEVKALQAAGVPSEWDHESLWQREYGIMMPDCSLFAGVRQVPPGHYLLASRSGVTVHRFWDFDFPRSRTSPLQTTKTDWKERLRHNLEEAVRLRLRADVPVGCYLSGGLDSAAVLGVAARLGSRPMRAFTLAFDHEEYDEESQAREVAQNAGAELEVVPISQLDLAGNFSDSIWHCETLCYNAGTTARYLLSSAARNSGYKAVLTGEGADEIFGGYAHFRQDMLRSELHDLDQEALKKLNTDLRSRNTASASLLMADPHADERMSAIRDALGFVPAWMQASAMGFLGSRSFHSPDFKADFSDQDVYRVFLDGVDVRGQLLGREPLHQSLYLWSRTVLPGYLLRTLGDGVEMAHSVEGRLPFLDHELVEAVRSMPLTLRINGMTEKYVLREAVRPLIPDSVYRREKRPFMAPPATIEPNGAMMDLVQDTLRSPILHELPFYDQPAVVRLLDLLPDMPESRRGAVDAVLMKILSACLLQDRFGLG